MVSIITPFYNSERFLAESITSVLNQSEGNWELLLINDGSTDNSKEIAKSFEDPRIRYFEQSNYGVSVARNSGLKEMKGDYFCFLDADDVLPQNSLNSRISVFKKSPYIEFVDGKVEKWNTDLAKKVGEWQPCYVGNPLIDLLSLNGKSFFGPSWMIKRKINVEYQFMKGLTHGEDLLFYASLAKRNEARYDFTTDSVLKYRIHSESAMRSDLENLENGYNTIFQVIKNWPEISSELTSQFRRKSRMIMCKSYLRRGQFLNAFRALK
ncbi:glycosyltransferase family 2 protein [Ekhidna sp. MALMAid0563]|uniref:glycosyltransferase family 2 protein n=1 Tax=Ekhidna sp. MALMAid0563 TaxID=3143937 RepID=UPI0032DF6D33